MLKRPIQNSVGDKAQSENLFKPSFGYKIVEGIRVSSEKPTEWDWFVAGDDAVESTRRYRQAAEQGYDDEQ